MKVVKCEKCNQSIPTILNVNSRVLFYYKQEYGGHVELICDLAVYCPTCGRESKFSINHIFSKEFPNFSELSAEHLRDISLCESGVI